MKMNDTVKDITMSKARIQLPFKGDSLLDALNFGFSFIESEDHYVHYVAANPSMMKRILGEIPEAVLDPTSESLGELWTARLLLSRKLNDRQVVFSNNTFSAVVDINLDPNQGAENATL